MTHQPDQTLAVSTIRFLTGRKTHGLALASCLFLLAAPQLAHAQQTLGTPLPDQPTPSDDVAAELPSPVIETISTPEREIEDAKGIENDQAASPESAMENQAGATGEGNSEPLTIENAQLSLIQNAFIATPVPGVVAEVHVREGDRVESGEVLIVLNSDQAQRELTAARAALQAARARSENDVDRRYAQRTLSVRQTELRQSEEANEIYAGAVSENEVQQLRLEVDQATLAIEQAEHELEVAMADAVEKEAAVQIAQTQVDHHTVRTTVDGFVTQVDTEIGEWAEPGKPIVRIISLDPIRAECFIDGREHGPQLVGRNVSFTLSAGTAGTETKLKGKVVFVSPEIHPVTGQTRLWATLANPGEKASVGMLGRLVIEPSR